MVDGTWHFVWLGGKKYSRRTETADNSRTYGVYAGGAGFETGGHWQKLSARCKQIMAKIDAAIAAADK